MAAADTRLLANAIRALAMDAVQTANSGHPGLPSAMADVATILWTEYLKHDPKDPAWHDRDRFVLSAGHGSMLIYSLLHLLGYEQMKLDHLTRFRQRGSPPAGDHGQLYRARRRDRRRAARPRARQCGRHGARRAHVGRAVRRRPGRPSHLCARL